MKILQILILVVRPSRSLKTSKSDSIIHLSIPSFVITKTPSSFQTIWTNRISFRTRSSSSQRLRDQQLWICQFPRNRETINISKDRETINIFKSAMNKIKYKCNSTNRE
jgi:hypothetical protein